MTLELIANKPVMARISFNYSFKIDAWKRCPILNHLFAAQNAEAFPPRHGAWA
jgi:hypothetical protein